RGRTGPSRSVSVCPRRCVPGGTRSWRSVGPRSARSWTSSAPDRSAPPSWSPSPSWRFSSPPARCRGGSCGGLPRHSWENLPHLWLDCFRPKIRPAKAAPLATFAGSFPQRVRSADLFLHHPPPATGAVAEPAPTVPEEQGHQYPEHADHHEHDANRVDIEARRVHADGEVQDGPNCQQNKTRTEAHCRLLSRFRSVEEIPSEKVVETLRNFQRPGGLGRGTRR